MTEPIGRFWPGVLDPVIATVRITVPRQKMDDGLDCTHHGSCAVNKQGYMLGACSPILDSTQSWDMEFFMESNQLSV